MCAVPGGVALCLLFLLALPGASRAQQEQSPVASALRTLTQRFQQNLVGAAEEMPADKYGYKPTPEQMSFGQLVLHVAGSNDYLCSTISGEKPPGSEKLQPTASKERLVTRLRSSFAYCSTALAKLNDTRLGERVPFFGGREVTRAAAILALAEDWGDHYGAAAVYLRLNGVLPPTARRGEGK
jgi:uncharacterized damage-inducible protein DinB